MLTFYTTPGTIALASHLALEEAGLPYTLQWVDFSQQKQRSDAYLSVNPKGRVPCLVTPDGPLTETPALLEYIAEQAPDGALMPSGDWAKARVRETLSWLASTVHVNHAHKMRGSRWTDDKVAHAALTAHVPVTMTQSAREIETRLEEVEGPWLFDALTVADLHLFAITRWLPGDGVDMSGFPRLSAHQAAMSARPATQRALAQHP
jgi:glutathione S-transferase